MSLLIHTRRDQQLLTSDSLYEDLWPSTCYLPRYRLPTSVAIARPDLGFSDDNSHGAPHSEHHHPISAHHNHEGHHGVHVDGLHRMEAKPVEHALPVHSNTLDPHSSAAHVPRHHPIRTNTAPAELAHHVQPSNASTKTSLNGSTLHEQHSRNLHAHPLHPGAGALRHRTGLESPVSEIHFVLSGKTS